jgi:Domain of unknown function (DUF4440)
MRLPHPLAAGPDTPSLEICNEGVFVGGAEVFPMAKDILSHLTEIERTFWAASGDPEFYRSHLAKDGMIVLAEGLMDAESAIDAMGSASPWLEYSLGDPELIDVADDVAALVYRARARRDPAAPVYEAFISSLYVLRNGDWKLILHQQSPCQPSASGDRPPHGQS